MSGYTVNELLCFATSQFDKVDKTALLSTLLDFYSREEIVEAKQLLIAECGKCQITNISEFSKNRISSNVEQKHLKDILDIWEIVAVSCKA